VLANSEAGSNTPSVTARLMVWGTKDESDEKPEVEKRIGSIRAEICIAPGGAQFGRAGRRALAAKKRRGARWTSGHTIGSRNAPHHPALQSRNGAQPCAFAGWAALRPKKSAHYTRAVA
jgi:hypothetical protein